jgi:hypothetical protein
MWSGSLAGTQSLVDEQGWKNAARTDNGNAKDR